jgi:hypothetical protein
MIKALKWVGVSIVLVMIASPSVVAGSVNGQTANSSSYWNGVWQDFKADWREIGKGFKDAGVNTGRAFKKEFKTMPQQIRKDIRAVKDDFKTFTGSDGGHPPEK